jgi:lipopolysaccharide biosynthesis protein
VPPLLRFFKKTSSFLRSRIKHGRPPYLFDADWYIRNYVDVAKSGRDPWAHYLEFGTNENRQPNSYFDAGWYSDFYKDVDQSGLIPFLHYCKVGFKEGRQPRPLSRHEKLIHSDKINYFRNEYNWRHYTAIDGRLYSQYAGVASDPLGNVDKKIKAIAFYLPQMHPIPENDAWWGKGFTEWTNVSKAAPRFANHYQPRIPAELGYYDLRCPEVMIRQVELAKLYGLSGFCFYYYWFDGKRLLERPLNEFLARPEMDIDFCLCWANENWTRRWDGLNSDILIAQAHTEADSRLVFEDWLKYFNDSRYIKIDGRPLILIYRPDLIPDFPQIAAMWREQAKSHGFEDLYILGASGFNNKNLDAFGLDQTYDFPPHTIQAPVVSDTVDWLDPDAETTVYSYPGAVDYAVNRYADSQFDNVGHPGVLVGWDTEARKPGKGDVFIESSPAEFRRWLVAAFEAAHRTAKSKPPLVFLNAWNEWAEGTYLEPDRKHGYAYLTALRSVVREFGVNPTTLESVCRSHNIGSQKTSDKVILLHLFYFDLVPEFKLFLTELRRREQIDLVVTIPELWSPEQLHSAIKELSPTKIFTAPNCGRDVFPFLLAAQNIADDGYKIGCKIHSKKSTHRIDGELWRKDLLHSLLAPSAIAQLDTNFFENHEYGLAAPSNSLLPLKHAPYIDGNIVRLSELRDRFAKGTDIREGEFVGGTMFWYKFETLQPLFNANFASEDFGVDLGQVDGTLAHAFERFFSIFVRGCGQKILAIHSDDFSFRIDARAQEISHSSRI